MILSPSSMPSLPWNAPGKHEYLGGHEEKWEGEGLQKMGVVVLCAVGSGDARER